MKPDDCDLFYSHRDTRRRLHSYGREPWANGPTAADNNPVLENSSTLEAGFTNSAFQTWPKRNSLTQVTQYTLAIKNKHMSNNDDKL